MSGFSRRLASAALCLLLASSPTYAARPEPDAVISFPAGSDDLSAVDLATLQHLAAKASADPANWINVEAYSDDPGSREMNLALAQRRIEDISHRLAICGFPANRIRGINFADKRVEEDDLPLGRVEIRILKFGL